MLLLLIICFGKMVVFVFVGEGGLRLLVLYRVYQISTVFSNRLELYIIKSGVLVGILRSFLRNTGKNGE